MAQNNFVNTDGEFTLGGEVVDRNGNIRVATRSDSVFNGKTVSLQVKGPGGNWYNTGVSFKESGAQVLAVREGMTYRFISDSDFDGTTINFMFF